MSNQSDQIESYINGELNPSELSLFERQLASDPVLQEEVAFQKDVVEGIKVFRRNQMKARLSQIDVTYQQPFWQSLPFKAATVAVVGGSIGGWLYFQSAENTQPEKMVISGGPEYEKKVVLPDVPDLSETLMVVEKPDEKPVIIPLTEERTETLVEASVEEKPKKIFTPTLEVPSQQELSESDSFVVPELQEDLVVSSPKSSSQRLQIRHEDAESEIRKYQYGNGKLALYGKFGSNPYEIIEINSEEGKALYLLLEESYFYLKPSSTPQPLIQVTDKEIIQEIDILLKEK